jgi:hypothetical protein
MSASPLKPADSLHRLLKDYKQPLVESSPPILSENKEKIKNAVLMLKLSIEP